MPPRCRRRGHRRPGPPISKQTAPACWARLHHARHAGSRRRWPPAARGKGTGGSQQAAGWSPATRLAGGASPPAAPTLKRPAAGGLGTPAPLSRGAYLQLPLQLLVQLRCLAAHLQRAAVAVVARLQLHSLLEALPRLVKVLVGWVGGWVGDRRGAGEEAPGEPGEAGASKAGQQARRGAAKVRPTRWSRLPRGRSGPCGLSPAPPAPSPEAASADRKPCEV